MRQIKCDILGMSEKTLPPSYAPAWRSKCAAARLLGINRKTIQRKVRAGLLPEDAAGRVCVDRLAALLTADALRGRRGPRLQLRADKPRPRYEWTGAGFVKTADNDDPVGKMGVVVNRQVVAQWKKRMVLLNAATLREVASIAMTISRHRGRMARLGLKLSPDEMLEALARGQATAAAAP